MEAFKTLYDNENTFLNKVLEQCNDFNAFNSKGGKSGTLRTKGNNSLFVQEHRLTSHSGIDIIVAKGIFASGFLEIKLEKDGYYYIIERNNDEIVPKSIMENNFDIVCEKNDNYKDIKNLLFWKSKKIPLLY